MNNVDRNGCGCCEGVEVQTPMEISNLPGLSAISYRVGTYTQFKQSMQARLADSNLPGLSRLKTRRDDDFSIALLDAWAVVADVLTFYQERVANESYKRTATERVSLLELGRMVGYELRPGVAANSYLAFTLEEAAGSPGRAIIDIGTKVQSLPNPGEQPQIFETVERIEARAAWNAMKPRLTRPPDIEIDMPLIVLKGTNTNIRPGDALLIIVKKTDDAGKTKFDKAFRRVKDVQIDTPKQQTTVKLEPYVPPAPGGQGQPTAASTDGQGEPTATPPAASGQGQPAGTVAGGQGQSAATPPAAGGQGQPVAVPVSTPSAQPVSQTSSSNGAAAKEQVLSLFKKSQPLNNTTVEKIVSSPVLPQRDLEALAVAQRWSVKDLFANIAARSQPPAGNGAAAQPGSPESPGSTGTTAETEQPPAVPLPVEPGVYALRVRASLFGHNAPDWKLMPDIIKENYTAAYQALVPTDRRDPKDLTKWPEWPFFPPPPKQLALDRVYSQVIPGSWVVVEQPGMEPSIAQVTSVKETAASDFALSGKITRIELDSEVIKPTSEGGVVQPLTFLELRQVTIYGQSDQLTPADLPIDKPVQGSTIDVPGLYDGLGDGRTVMVTGEPINSAVRTNELAVLGDPTVDYTYPGGLTTLNLKGGSLANKYKPETVAIYGNIARATQGETVSDEVLGSGDASQPYQRFTLRQSPLTYVQAPTQTGTASTLAISVNAIPWQEVPSLYGHGPRDRVFVTHIEDDGKVTVQFGDGRTGARLPTDDDNVQATYRKGIGQAGLVQPGQLSVLLTRPLGVKGVSNPLAPTGTDDPETIDDARRNADNTVLTLGRIVSGADYEDFARSYVGVAKAHAEVIWTNRVRGVFVTIAGPATPDNPQGTEIKQDSGLYRKIYSGMRRASDPTIPLTVQSYTTALFRVAARVKIDPTYAQERVLVPVEQALLSHFGFDARSFGQPVTLKEVIAVMQTVRGVVTVYIDALYRVHLGGAPEKNDELDAALPHVQKDGSVSSAELLIIDPNSPLDSLGVIP